MKTRKKTNPEKNIGGISLVIEAVRNAGSFFQKNLDMIHVFVYYFIGTVRIVSGAGFMKRYSVRPSVRLFFFRHRPTAASAAGLLLWAKRAGSLSIHYCNSGA